MQTRAALDAESDELELIFPPRLIPDLEGLGDVGWRGLVRHVLALGEAEPDRAAFVLLMARLCNCSTCHADALKAMHGCLQCSGNALRRYRGSEADLLFQFQTAREEVDRYLEYLEQQEEQEEQMEEEEL